MQRRTGKEVWHEPGSESGGFAGESGWNSGGLEIEIRIFSLNQPVTFKKLVEAAGIEPASVSPTHTGGYMLSPSSIWPATTRRTGLQQASPPRV